LGVFYVHHVTTRGKAMPLIYEPTGKAREYSPLALNLYTSCDHACDYCFVPMIRRSAPGCRDVNVRKDGLKLLARELAKGAPQQQILMSFMSDPYNHLDVDMKLTREGLKILNAAGALVAILTKGGLRALRDLDVFKTFGPRIKVGATLTFSTAAAARSAEIEPFAAPPAERLEMLRVLHEAGVRTWASIEPVIDPAESLRIMEESLPFVDAYKIGKMNHFEKRYGAVDWGVFLRESVGVMRRAGKPFYIKEDLRKFQGDVILNPEECDSDFL
jgi:DNA repair photolyase